MNGLIKKVYSGLPFALKEAGYAITDRTPFFLATPQMVYIGMNNLSCNGRCIMCPRGLININHPESKQTHSLFPEKSFIKLIDEIRELCGKSVVLSFTGGEPLLYKPLFNIAKYAYQQGMRFSFTTNGYLLNENNAKQVIDSKLFNIGVSLESLDPKINETIRAVPGGTKRTVDGIDMLIEEKEKSKSDLSINIKCTLTQVNFHSIIDIVKKYGKTKGVFISPQPFNKFIDDNDIIQKLWVKDIEEFKKVIDELISLKENGYAINGDKEALLEFIPYFESQLLEDGTCNTSEIDNKKREVKNICTVQYSTIFININDDKTEVHICPFMKPIGLLEDNSTLKEKWYGEIAKEIREKAKNCYIPCNLSCTRKQSLFDKIRLYLKIR